MISPQNIERMVGIKAYRPLIQRILGNGRCYDPAVIARLSKPPADAPAALGLALQRTVELAYGPTPLINELIEKLEQLQQPSGLFGGSASPDLAASAIALRGLLLGFAQGKNIDEVSTISSDATLKRGFNVLISRLNSDAIESIDDIEIAVILWQLSDVPTFRSRVDIAGLIKKLQHDQAQSNNDEFNLPEYVRAVAA